MALPGLHGDGKVWLIGEPDIANALATVLRARGVQTEVGTALPDDANACIYLGGLRAVNSIDEAIGINREAFVLARQLAKPLDSGRGLLVSVQDTGGGFGLLPMPAERAWLAGLPALLKTAALEWPQATLKAIDLERAGRDADSLAQCLANELLEGGGEIEIALSANGERSTLRSVADAVQPGQPVIGADDVVLVSGGARGVTAGCMVEWAKVSQARFVLLGRTALSDEPGVCAGIEDDAALKRVLLGHARAQGQTLSPAQLQAQVRTLQSTREVRRTVAQIEATGAQVRYQAVDVADAAALAALLDSVRAEWGPITAVVHAAGVLADKRIGEKTDAMFDAVFDTKVKGLQALLTATANDPLKALAVFSSVSARCGNTGQADYAMANEVLAKVVAAEARQRPGLLAKSFGWGPWQGGMVSPSLRDRFAALGVPMIALDAGARQFAAEMSAAQTDQIELVFGGEPRPEALLFDGAQARVQTLEVMVDRASHGYLEGHAIHGQPVLPLVLAAEWLTRAARSFRPGLPHVELHDVKVLKGIRLAGFDAGGDRFTIEATPLPSTCGAHLQMSIRDAMGLLNYSARIALLPAPDTGASDTEILSLEPWHGAPLYQDLLFHRGPFELIHTLDGISDHGLRATLRGVSEAGWQAEAWQLDVAALDAGLQLAVLFGHRLLGGPNLPTGIDQIRAFEGAPSTGLLSASAYRRKLSHSAITTDIVLTDARGKCVAELLGVHNHSLA